MVALDPETGSLGRLHWLGIGCAAVTGVVHLSLGIAAVGTPVGQASVAAGLGFFGAIVLVVLDVRRRLVYLAGIPYTASQIALWWILNDVGPGDLLAVSVGTVDKAVQTTLIAVLVVLSVREWGSDS